MESVGLNDDTDKAKIDENFLMKLLQDEISKSDHKSRSFSVHACHPCVACISFTLAADAISSNEDCSAASAAILRQQLPASRASVTCNMWLVKSAAARVPPLACMRPSAVVPLTDTATVWARLRCGGWQRR